MTLPAAARSVSTTATIRGLRPMAAVFLFLTVDLAVVVGTESPAFQVVGVVSRCRQRGGGSGPALGFRVGGRHDFSVTIVEMVVVAF
jgi:hypothetical protein